jgi:hypothetical protein
MSRHTLTSEYQTVLTCIARQRRRIDRHAGTLLDHSLLVGSWRTYVEQHPARALLAAAGVGMTFSLFAAGGVKYASRIGRRLYDAATGAAWGEVWGELRTILDLFGDGLGESVAGEDDDG